MNAFTGRIRRFPGLTLATLLALVVLLSLSFWQMQRLRWKEAKIAEMQQMAALPPLPVSSAAELAALPEFRRVQLVGHFRHDLAQNLQARYLKANLGFHRIVPLVLKDGSAVWVNRGWIPKDYRVNPKVVISEPKGEQRLIGMVRLGEHPRSYLPQNDPAKGLWLWQDPAAWSEKVKPQMAVVPVLVQLIHNEARDDGFPIPQEAHLQLRNDHLQYALTWALLAIGLLVVYWVYTNPKRV